MTGSAAANLTSAVHATSATAVVRSARAAARAARQVGSAQSRLNPFYEETPATRRRHLLDEMPTESQAAFTQKNTTKESLAVAAARAALQRPGMAAVTAHIPGGSAVVGESATERFRLARQPSLVRVQERVGVRHSSIKMNGKVQKASSGGAASILPLIGLAAAGAAYFSITSVPSQSVASSRNTQAAVALVSPNDSNDKAVLSQPLWLQRRRT